MIKHALATIERGAVGNHALGINEALSQAGVPVATYAETIRPEFRSSVKSFDDFSSSLDKDDVVLYQLANPSPMADVLYEKPCRLIVNYHNITPARYFARWFPPTASAISRARSQLARLAPLSSAAIAVSEYNAAELVALGYRNVQVIPPIFSNTFFNETQAPQRDDSSWLFVGRIAPHKNIHVLVHALELYRRTDPTATLTIVGSCDTPLYGKAVNELIKERELESVITIISDADISDLVKLYSTSSVFVSASEHEGFCVPLIEAMASGLPVVAVSTSAIGDTAGSAAVLVDSPDPLLIAEAVSEVAQYHKRRDDLRERGFVRSEKFNPETTKQNYVTYLSGWV